MGYFYTVASPGTSFTTGKCMLGIFNGPGSGKVIKVYRMWLLNNQTVAVGSNLFNYMSFYRFTTGSGGLYVAPVKHDTTNPTPPPEIVTSTNMNYTTQVRLKRFLWSSDEPLAAEGNATAGSAGIDEWETIPAFNRQLDHRWSYTDTTVEPIILREGYGLGLVCDAAYTSAASPALSTPVGTADIFMEFEMV